MLLFGTLRVFLWLHAQFVLGPPISNLALVDGHGVLELAPEPDLQVVPGHERGGAAEVVALLVEDGDGVGAVVGHVLAAARAQHLQERDLVAVSLVREAEALVCEDGGGEEEEKREGVSQSRETMV